MQISYYEKILHCEGGEALEQEKLGMPYPWKHPRVQGQTDSHFQQSDLVDYGLPVAGALKNWMIFKAPSNSHDPVIP